MGEVTLKKKLQASLSAPTSLPMFPSLPACGCKKATLGSPDLNNVASKRPVWGLPTTFLPISRTLPVCVKDSSLTYLLFCSDWEECCGLFNYTYPGLTSGSEISMMLSWNWDLSVKVNPKPVHLQVTHSTNQLINTVNVKKTHSVFYYSLSTSRLSSHTTTVWVRLMWATTLTRHLHSVWKMQ